MRLAIDTSGLSRARNAHETHQGLLASDLQRKNLADTSMPNGSKQMLAMNNPVSMPCAKEIALSHAGFRACANNFYATFTFSAYAASRPGHPPGELKDSRAAAALSPMFSSKRCSNSTCVAFSLTCVNLTSTSVSKFGS